MRVNVYGEELTDRIEVIEKHVDDYTFYGVRFWLKFPNQDWWIHRKVDGVEDDDSSVITIWGRNKEELAGIFRIALHELSPTDERIYEVRSGYGYEDAE